jgi:hypothetical protein
LGAKTRLKRKNRAALSLRPGRLQSTYRGEEAAKPGEESITPASAAMEKWKKEPPMSLPRTFDSRNWTEPQIAALKEWRNLCFALERAQADDLIRNCRDRFAYAKTYLAWTDGLDDSIARVRRDAEQGDFRFFTSRGVPACVMSRALAEHMLRNLRGAVASKQDAAEVAFAGRFKEDLGVFSAAANNEGRVRAAQSNDEGDAVLLLDRWAAEAPLSPLAEAA